jgi:hypothetical protein
MSIFGLFSKTDTSPARGASIELRCCNLSPQNYFNAAKAIENSGVKGIMEMTPNGKIKLDIEGPFETIEKLMSKTQSSLLGCTCENELTWKPFANRHRTFLAHPFLVVKSPPCDKRPI